MSRKSSRLFGLIASLQFISHANTIAEEPEQTQFEGFSRKAEDAIDQWLSALERVETYYDAGEISMKMSGMGNFSMPGQKQSVVFERPNRLHLQSMMMEIISDGKELTVYRKNNRRYKVEPLKEDSEDQLGDLGMVSGMGMVNFQIHELLIKKDGRSYLAQRFKDMDVSGQETIDGDRCTVIKGKSRNSFMGAKKSSPTVTLYLREKDRMLRRLEILPPPPELQDDGDEPAPFRGMMPGSVYDFKELRVNKPVDRSEFEFKPPRSAKKVARFYDDMASQPSGSQQFELSGKPAPTFDLQTTDDARVSLGDFKGKVAVLYFMHAWPKALRRSGMMEESSMGSNPLLKAIDELRADFQDKDIEFLGIYPDEDAEDLLKSMNEADQKIRIALDPNRETTSDYFDQPWKSGVVLLGKDSLVQGWIPTRYEKGVFEENLRKNIEKLLAGETLDSGVAMTKEELKEMRAQSSSYFGEDAAEPLNEEYLHEAWSVSTQQSGMHFGNQNGEIKGDGMWIQTRNRLQEINAEGKVVEEFSLPGDANPFRGTSEQFAVGKFRGQRVAVRVSMAFPDGLNVEAKQSKEAKLSAFDEKSNELWSLNLAIENFQTPQQLQMADLDRSGMDKILFVHQAAIWIVDEKGHPIVRKDAPGMISWLRAEDRDRDGRAEVYVRTQNSLTRYDYSK